MKLRVLAASLTLVCGGHAATPAAEDTTVERRIHAPSPGGDGVYGRFDGSLDFGVSAGVELEDEEPRAVLRISGHYWWTAGAYLRYSDGFGGNDRRPLRVLSTGIDLRPLFLPRFALDLQQGPAFVDLLLDSLSLSAGAYLARPDDAAFADERGFDLGVGGGVPLLAEASGPWLEARAERRFADRADGAWLFTLSVAYRTLILPTEPDR
jgi:hypothetical protein